MKKVATILLAVVLSTLLIAAAAEAKPPKLTKGSLKYGMWNASGAVFRGLNGGNNTLPCSGPGYYECSDGVWGSNIRECWQTKTRTTARGCHGWAWTRSQLVDYEAYRKCKFDVTVSTKRIKGGLNPIFRLDDHLFTQRSSSVVCGPLVPDWQAKAASPAGSP